LHVTALTMCMKVSLAVGVSNAIALTTGKS
jgi:hypothetical protein